MKKLLLFFTLFALLFFSPQPLLANHAVEAVPFILGGLAIGAAILIVLIAMLVLYGLAMLLALLNLFIRNKVMHIINLILGIIITVLYLIVAIASLLGGGSITYITLIVALFWGIWYTTKKRITARKHEKTTFPPRPVA